MHRLFLFALIAYYASAAVVDRSAVVVGSDVITESEILDEIRITAFLNGETPDFSAVARRSAAERLVDQALIRQEMATGQYPQPTDSDVDGMVANLEASRFHGDAAYRAALARYGVTAAEVRAHLRWQLAALRFTDTRFQGGMPAVPALNAGADQADREAPGPNSAPPPRQTTMRATRLARPRNVDERLEAWLKDARKRTRVVFIQEAFK